MNKLKAFSFAWLYVGVSQASFQMNNQKIMEISVSDKGLTRLSVQGDIIQDIFVYPLMIGETLLQDSLQLHKSGHVFIAPEGLHKPFYVTVMTQKGQVQDLKLTPSSQHSRPVILTLAPPEVDPQHALDVERKALTSSLRTALQGIVPPNFNIKRLTPNPPSEDRGAITMTILALYTFKEYSLSVYELENSGEQPLFLTPEFFLAASDLALVFDQPSLRPQGKGRMAVLRIVAPVFLISSTPVRSSERSS